MYFSFTCLFFLFVPITSGNSSNNTSTSNNTEISNKTVTPEPYTGDSTGAKLEMLSEGGAILPVLPKLPPLSLPKGNHTNLISLDKEIGKTKEKPVVPRKGVIYNPLEDSVSTKVDSHKERIDTSVPKAAVSNETSKKPDLLKNSTEPDINNGSLVNIQEVTTEKPKKPLVLSYEALNAVGKTKDNVQSPKIESSSKNIVVDQLPTPNVKVNQMNTSRHPGMVMPIVITMLVVPMFAVLGYMALRRGQEAWKNRHYKRMDFLLDGMYND